MTRRLVGLDFETYSAVNLPRHGLHRYTSSSTFCPLIVSHAHRDGSGLWATTIDFTLGMDSGVDLLEKELRGATIVAHNAGFEQRVLAAIGLPLPSDRFIDSAVIARAMGAGGSLEAAAPQLLGTDKLEVGKRLIQLFSIPGRLQEETDCLAFDPRIKDMHPEDWELFAQYCEVDSMLGLRIAMEFLDQIPAKELDYQAITMDMNNTGWPVDVPVVEEMQRRYLENVESTVERFREDCDAADLNLNSLKQLKEWCLDRGIKATSFDEKHVAKLIERIEKKLDSYVYDYQSGSAKPDKWDGYNEVLSLLKAKQALGGSSLKKLQVILDTTGKDCRLKDQYLHVGAGQSWRTTGRSVQMQNLKQLKEPAVMEELEDLDSEWDNEKLAANIRQTFTSSHPLGQLVVGDFSSIEARGLCWLAGDIAKLESYRQGSDMYKVLAAEMYNVDYYDVTKEQRQGGKVGVLSCGYGAGGGAVQAFAEKMHIALTEAEANALVSDWRTANPLVVSLWDELDGMLHDVVEGNHPLASIQVGPRKDWRVKLYQVVTPQSLLSQHPAAQSVCLAVESPLGEPFLTRYFHGCYVRGRNICYYKPSERKTGDLWSSHFTDPKTKQVKFYSVYGGKLAGILTQSFCREMFFHSLRLIHNWVKTQDNVDLIGQFHDEIVLDWRPVNAGEPGYVSLESVMNRMQTYMSDVGLVQGFPLAAEIKHDYRYTK